MQEMHAEKHGKGPARREEDLRAQEKHQMQKASSSDRTEQVRQGVPFVINLEKD